MEFLIVLKPLLGVLIFLLELLFPTFHLKCHQRFWKIIVVIKFIFQNKHLNITNTPWCCGLLWCKMIQSFIRFFSRWSDIIKQARISLREQDCEAPGCHRQLTLGNWKKLVFLGRKLLRFRAVNEWYLFGLVVRVSFCICSVKEIYVRKLLTLVSS